MTDPKFIKRKQPNKKRAFVLLIILIIVIIIFYNIDKIIDGLFTVK